ncbi:MAG: pentapeptide repeat-containing protein [Proteobacteria bacterium]|nr:pentapeptide repeat-containing protein [Pseudomonadota bacterium]
MTHSLPARRPVSAWNKPLEVEGKGLFKALTRAIGHGITGRWAELANDAAGVLTSFGLDTRPEERAWLLIRRALVRAVFDLVAEYRHQLSEQPDRKQLLVLADQLDNRLEAAELEIRPDFVDRPGDLSIVADVAPLLGQWLSSYGVREADTRAIADRLRAYFAHILNAEWRESRAFYTPILDALDTPFAAASAHEQAWQENAARLRRQVNERMFGESFGLEQVYVRRRAACGRLADASDEPGELAGPEPDGDERARAHSPGDRGVIRAAATGEDGPSHGRVSSAAVSRDVVDLAGHLCRWLDDADRHDAIRVISGGPGSGKSSFARMFAVEWTERSSRVVYVPLFEFDLADSLTSAMDSYARRLGLPAGLFDPDRGEGDLLVIFDGLDELSLRGRLGAETVRQFVRLLERSVRDMNRDRCRLRVLVTGRDIAVQATEAELRKPGQILHLLPYYVPVDARASYSDPDHLLARDDRDTWWARYGWAAGLEIGSMPDELRRADLDEITSEPLLCYLVALSYVGGRIDFTGGEVNLNEIYHDLLDSVYERGYEGSRRHKSVSNLSERQFVEILEEIGLASWHGGGRTATLDQIRLYCTRSPRLAKLIDRFEKDAEAGVTSLMAAFYFRQGEADERGDRTFEFTHRSFGEYLAGRRIVRACARMVNRVTAGDEGDEDGWTESDALVHWVEICGAAELDHGLLPFVRGEIGDQDDSVLHRWQRIFGRLIGRMLRTGMPMERLERVRFATEVKRARNAEAALFVVLDACARVTETLSAVRWPAKGSFGDWLRTVQGQAAGDTRPVVLQCLSYLDLHRTTLRAVDLGRAVLRHSNFKNSQFAYALLNNADLTGANLDDAILRRADVNGGRLSGAVLRAALLLETRLENASLTGADLTQASLRDAVLHDAVLTGATLRKADLTGASLRGANLEGADLRGAILDGADLRNVRYSDQTIWPAGFDPAKIPTL